MSWLRRGAGKAAPSCCAAASAKAASSSPRVVLEPAARRASLARRAVRARGGGPLGRLGRRGARARERLAATGSRAPCSRESLDRALRFADSLHVGMVGVNAAARRDVARGLHALGRCRRQRLRARGRPLRRARDVRAAARRDASGAGAVTSPRRIGTVRHDRRRDARRAARARVRPGLDRPRARSARDAPTSPPLAVGLPRGRMRGARPAPLVALGAAPAGDRRGRRRRSSRPRSSAPTTPWRSCAACATRRRARAASDRAGPAATEGARLAGSVAGARSRSSRRRASRTRSASRPSTASTRS